MFFPPTQWKTLRQPSPLIRGVPELGVASRDVASLSNAPPGPYKTSSTFPPKNDLRRSMGPIPVSSRNAQQTQPATKRWGSTPRTRSILSSRFQADILGTPVAARKQSDAPRPSPLASALGSSGPPVSFSETSRPIVAPPDTQASRTDNQPASSLAVRENDRTKGPSAGSVEAHAPNHMPGTPVIPSSRLYEKPSLMSTTPDPKLHRYSMSTNASSVLGGRSKPPTPATGVCPSKSSIFMTQKNPKVRDLNDLPSHQIAQPSLVEPLVTNGLEEQRLLCGVYRAFMDLQGNPFEDIGKLGDKFTPNISSPGSSVRAVPSAPSAPKPDLDAEKSIDMHTSPDSGASKHPGIWDLPEAGTGGNTDFSLTPNFGANSTLSHDSAKRTGSQVQSVPLQPPVINEAIEMPFMPTRAVQQNEMSPKPFAPTQRLPHSPQLPPQFRRTLPSQSHQPVAEHVPQRTVQTQRNETPTAAVPPSSSRRTSWRRGVETHSKPPVPSAPSPRMRGRDAGPASHCIRKNSAVRHESPRKAPVPRRSVSPALRANAPFGSRNSTTLPSQRQTNSAVQRTMTPNKGRFSRETSASRNRQRSQNTYPRRSAVPLTTNSAPMDAPMHNAPLDSTRGAERSTQQLYLQNEMREPHFQSAILRTDKYPPPQAHQPSQGREPFAWELDPGTLPPVHNVYEASSTASTTHQFLPHHGEPTHMQMSDSLNASQRLIGDTPTANMILNDTESACYAPHSYHVVSAGPYGPQSTWAPASSTNAPQDAIQNDGRYLQQGAGRSMLSASRQLEGQGYQPFLRTPHASASAYHNEASQDRPGETSPHPIYEVRTAQQSSHVNAQQDRVYHSLNTLHQVPGEHTADQQQWQQQQWQHQHDGFGSMMNTGQGVENEFSCPPREASHQLTYPPAPAVPFGTSHTQYAAEQNARMTTSDDIYQQANETNFDDNMARRSPPASSNWQSDNTKFLQCEAWVNQQASAMTHVDNVRNDHAERFFSDDAAREYVREQQKHYEERQVTQRLPSVPRLSLPTNREEEQREHQSQSLTQAVHAATENAIQAIRCAPLTGSQQDTRSELDAFNYEAYREAILAFDNTPPACVKTFCEALAMLMDKPKKRYDANMAAELPLSILQGNFSPAQISRLQYHRLVQMFNSSKSMDTLQDICPPAMPLYRYFMTAARELHGKSLKEVFDEPSVSDKFIITPDIWRMTETQKASVDGLTILRPEVGEIVFTTPVDVRGMDFDRDIVLEVGEVVVYPDELRKPQPGVGLNNPCHVTLFNCLADTNMDSVRQERFFQKIRSMTEAKGAHFISYNLEKGIWKFEVNHF